MPSHLSKHLPVSMSRRKPTKGGPSDWPGAWKNSSLTELERISGVCLDIDDTLTTEGKLTPEAYAALWKLKAAGFVVVPVTGRPAGWCDHIVRFWPVDAIVGENGAFTFFMEKGIRNRMDTPLGTGEHPEAFAKKRKALETKIKRLFPQVRWASDQEYREFDLAVDICEDVPPWSDPDIRSLLALCARMGAHAKLSSIHVNAWFGSYDKRKGFNAWLRQSSFPSVQKLRSLDRWIYIGDSPNDEPMFENFRYSVGVANLQKYLGSLHSPPTWITQKASGKGFVEFAQRLVRARRSGR